ncbi:hypothetical protein DICVIV_02525 [Dictyocaulus viviparus]|uniref:Uncharacterized protein n=1 Tax=Dictyocaulus viviparus TaxID=29172 RepID=A0A0D8Y563_DICVI|nr:hypothetical protein DICVIV_02525 [Dictyocaulus viviparus]
MSLEQFVIRNIPNTYVVRESDGNVSYMQLHTSIETFNASLKRNRINVRKRRDSKEFEYFKSHVLLAVYGVNRPGQEVCEMLKECLQKRLDQVTLNHLIDTLAKNSQTRLDSADVQFLQRDATVPADVFNYSIPNSMSQFLQPLIYYMHQHMQAIMPSARFKEDYGSGSNNNSEQRSVFLPLPFLGISETYVPIFYLLIKSPQEGIRSTGIAVIEMRLINHNGELATLTSGRLNSSTHHALTPSLDNSDDSHDVVYEKLVHTTRHEQLEEITDVCVYAQFAVWQAGDVDLVQLDDQLRNIVRLNLFRQRKLLPPPPSVDNNFGNETHLMLHLSQRLVCLLIHQFEAKVIRTSNRSPDYVNPDFVATAGPWFDFVVNKHSGIEVLDFIRSLCKQEAIYSEICHHSCPRKESDTLPYCDIHGYSIALREIAERISEQVRNVDPNYPDRVHVFEPNPRHTDMVHHTSTSSWTSCSSPKLHEKRYEIAASSLQYCMSADIGRDSCECDAPDALLVCLDMQVAIETQRFGFEPVGTCPETLLRLNNYVSKELFLPCTEESQFVPRRRILYGTVNGEKLTLYFYNFMPFLSASLINMVTRATSWYNARARLVREIGLHKMGITHLSPLECSQSSSENPYLVLVWRHPEELIDKDYPPDDLQVVAFFDHMAHADLCFR